MELQEHFETLTGVRSRMAVHDGYISWLGKLARTSRMHRRNLLHAATGLLATVVLSAFVSTAHADPITISSVTFTGSIADPTITIDGSNFGSTPLPTALALYGNTGLDYGTVLHITDTTNPLFDAGYDQPAAGLHDIIGLINLTYTDTSISYQMGSVYANYAEQFNVGDDFTVHVGSSAYSGVIDYNQAVTPEPSSLVLLATGGAGLLFAARFRAMRRTI